MASLSQNVSSPRDSQASNMDPDFITITVSEHRLGYFLLWTYGESYRQGLRDGEKRGWKRTLKKLGNKARNPSNRELRDSMRWREWRL
jgi:hypothetical protein